MGDSEQILDNSRPINTNDFWTIKLDEKMSVEEIYLTVYKETKRILDYFRSKIIPSSRAIDIRSLVKMLGIKIIEKPLVSSKERFYQETSGYLDCYDYKKNEFQWTIYVNNDMGDLSKRYIIAHELAHFLLKKNKEEQGVYTRYCVSPLFPKSIEEQLCDIVASFLLMPIDIVLDLMKEYLMEHTNEKINTFEWLRFLGCQMGVSDYHTVICYQNVRYLGGFLYGCKDMYKSVGLGGIIEKIEECDILFR